MTDEIRYLDDIRKVTFGPSDVLVVQVAYAIPTETADRIKTHLSEAIGTDNKIIVLSDGLKLGVLSPQE